MHKTFLEKMNFGQSFIIRMMPGDDIAQKIALFCQENHIDRAVIISAIGSASDVIFRDLIKGIRAPVEPAKTNELTMKGPYEILSLEGNIFPMNDELVVHLHILLGKEDGTVCGGHLSQARVFTTLELVLAEVKNSRIYRKKSRETGLNELLLD